MKTMTGYGYKFGGELHVSVDPVIGGWPLELQLDDDVELVPVTRHELRVKGEKLTTGQAMSRGLLKAADQAEAEAKFRLSKQEASIAVKAQRAKEAADKAVAKANALAEKAAKAAADALARASALASKAAR